MIEGHHQHLFVLGVQGDAEITKIYVDKAFCAVYQALMLIPALVVVIATGEICFRIVLHVRIMIQAFPVLLPLPKQRLHLFPEGKEFIWSNPLDFVGDYYRCVVVRIYVLADFQELIVAKRNATITGKGNPVVVFRFGPVEPDAVAGAFRLATMSSWKSAST